MHLGIKTKAAASTDCFILSKHDSRRHRMRWEIILELLVGIVMVFGLASLALADEEKKSNRRWT